MKVGEKFIYMGDEARIMAIAEGFVMARKKGRYPFLVTVKEVEGSLTMRPADGYQPCGLCGVTHDYMLCPEAGEH